MSKEKKGKKKQKDDRFDTKNDPRYFPIDTRTPIDAKFSQMFRDNFPLLQGKSVRNEKKGERHLKNALKSLYKVDGSREDIEIQKIKEQAKDEGILSEEEEQILDNDVEQYIDQPSDIEEKEQEDDLYEFSDNEEWVPEDVDSE